jgi:hypothetical protein
MPEAELNATSPSYSGTGTHILGAGKALEDRGARRFVFLDIGILALT